MNFIALTQLPKRLFAWGLAKANAADQTSIKLTNCQEHSSLADLKRSLGGRGLLGEHGIALKRQFLFKAMLYPQEYLRICDLGEFFDGCKKGFSSELEAAIEYLRFMGEDDLI